MTTAEPVVDVVGLAKRYGGRTVVRDVTLNLARGKMIGLVGANGGGKTTTLRLIAGLLQPDAGSGTVLGRDVGARSRRGGSAIGYMTQRPALYPDLTVAENLRFRADAHGLADPARRIDEAAATYGLGAVMARRVDRLSGGWARRAQFVATVLPGPALLLLDEPTAGLDATTRRDIWDWLAAFAAQGGAILISTHDLAEAERCPSILYYDDGRAHGPMTPAALIAQSGAATLEAAVMTLAAAR